MEKQKNIPKLRFPEFKGEWEKQLGSKLFEPISNKTHNSDLPILAISQEFGAVPREMINYQISVSEKSIDGYKVIEKGDFIISLRSFQGGIEYSNYKGICSPAYIILRSKVEINDHFYKIYFKSNNYIQALCSKLEGIRDGKMISYKYFSEIAIPEPTLAEQKRIASFFTVVDKKIAQLKTKKQLLQQYKKGVMQQLFSQTLKFKDENGKEFPKWEKKKLGEVCESLSSGKDKPNDNDNYPIYGSMGVIGYNSNFTYNKKSILIARVGANAGTINLVDGEYGVTDNTLVLINSNNIKIQFLYYLLVFQNLNKLVFGSGQPLITAGQLKSISLNIPSLAEQTKIANFLSSIDEKINRTETQIQATQAYKKGLLQNMFI